MYGTDFNPFSEWFRFCSSFARCGPWSGRRFYTRKERIEALENSQKTLLGPSVRDCTYRESVAGVLEVM